MSVEHIRSVIIDQARAEAERVLAEARSRREDRLRAARHALEAEFSRKLERGRQEAEAEHHRAVMLRRSEQNLALLRQRNEILDRLFAQAASGFADMSDEEHRAVMESWMRELPADTAGQVVCNERDRARLEPLVAKLNAGRPLEARLELSQQSAPLLGGVLFKTEKFEIDLSLDARLRQLREELVPEVSRIVFPADVTV